MRPAQPCFAGFTAGDFNPLALFRRLHGWGFQPARPLSPALRLGISTRSVFCRAHPRMRPAQPCFAGFTAGDFNPLALFRRLYGWGFQPARSFAGHIHACAPLNRLSPALRLGISTRSPSFAGFTAGDFNPLGLSLGTSTHAPRSTVFRRLYGWEFQPARPITGHIHACAPLNRLSPALRLGISTRSPSFAGFTAGGFNPLGLFAGTSTHAPRSTVFRRLYGWGFQPARPLSPALRLGISTRSASFAGSTAGDAPRSTVVSPALRLGISTRSPSFAGFTAGDFNPLGLSPGTSTHAPRSTRLSPAFRYPNPAFR